MNWKLATRVLAFLLAMLFVMAVVLGIVKIYELRTDQVQSDSSSQTLQ